MNYKAWVYHYDAQNRLTYASNGTVSAQFYYDGKNRQIARNINGVIRFNAWDNWELVEEYSSGLNVATGYLQGSTGVIKSWSAANTLYYYQDRLGSTTHVANASGQLVESYHYDLYGKPAESSTHGVVDLYAGERWILELGLYDLRNRFMSTELGRFLQPDPIGFKGDASNLYRYCHNDPEDFADPTGLYNVSKEMWERQRLFDTGSSSLAGLRELSQKIKDDAKRAFYEALGGFAKRRGANISPQQVIDAGIRDGRAAELLVRKDLRKDKALRLYGVERGYSEFVNGRLLEIGGPAVGPDDEFNPTVGLPTAPNSGANLGPRFMGIHAHGPQSGKSFDLKDVPLSEGQFGNKPFIGVVTSTFDKGNDVHFHVPGYGTWSTSNGGATFREGD